MGAAKQQKKKSDRNMVTLREASAETGASVSALRKWYRSGAVHSEITDGPHGQQRLVDVDEVRERVERYAELTERQPSRLPPPVPDGAMLVPKDSWDQVMAAVNSLHEAGERTGRAEEKADQYRQRIDELRSELAAAHAELAELKERLLQRRGVLRRR